MFKGYVKFPWYFSNISWNAYDMRLQVYDPSLRVTCPSDPCSVLKCGFRAQCKEESKEVNYC